MQFQTHSVFNFPVSFILLLFFQPQFAFGKQVMVERTRHLDSRREDGSAYQSCEEGRDRTMEGVRLPDNDVRRPSFVFV